MLEEKLKLVSKLWEGGIRTEYSYDGEENLDQQFLQAKTKGIPWAVVLNYKTYFSPDNAAPTVRVRPLDEKSKEGKGIDAYEVLILILILILIFLTHRCI